jgi:hypothetical protein
MQIGPCLNMSSRDEVAWTSCTSEVRLGLGAAQVAALHALGSDYQSTFSPLESDAALEQMPAAAALVVDGKEALGPRLLFSYNAQVLHHGHPAALPVACFKIQLL